MPPTIHALLAARIERLRPEDRAVLERAAIVGRQFSRSAVAHLLAREVTGWVGSEPERMFEILVVALVGLDPHRHGDRVHLYNLDQLDEARACYDALLEGAALSAPGEAGGGGSGRDDARPSRPDPLRIPPNAGSRAVDRALEAIATRDWPALRALTSRDMVWEDRQKHALLIADVEIWISSLQAV